MAAATPSMMLPGPTIPFQTNARYPDPAVEVLHDSFAALRLRSACVEQLASGGRWSEGPVWFGDLRCLLWSVMPTDRFLRWDDCSGAVAVFRSPSCSTPTGWRATASAGCSRASTAAGASRAPSTTARTRSSPITSAAGG